MKMKQTQTVNYLKNIFSFQRPGEMLKAVYSTKNELYYV